MSDQLGAVLSSVRQRVDPDAEERRRLQHVAETVIERTERAIASRDLEADVMLVGSTARETWIAGDRDIDVFVRFPPDTDRESLAEHGLAIGHEVLPDGHEEYAEHPYVVGRLEGYDVDLVPCYAVSDATAIRSAVDRTPFHMRYLDRHLTEELAADVRLCKAFLKGSGVYGSDLRTRGFSGYLTELLVLEHGGFEPLVEAAANWHPPVRFDPESHGTASFDDDLVVIDPTDPERNVAAALSTENLASFQHYARELLEVPRESLFEATPREPIDSAAVKDFFERRGTTPLAIVFETPSLVEDDLYPQLEKSLEGISKLLDRHGFEVLRAEAFAGQRTALLTELAVAERPRVERHGGPPVHVREHAERFFETYVGSDATGPFIEGDRYVVEREREYETAIALLGSDAVFDVALGAAIERALADGYEVVSGDDVASLATDFGRELAAYCAPKP